MGFLKGSIGLMAAFSCLIGDPLLGKDSEPDTQLDYFDALVYGLVEGVTEFLPVSSTGHLILAKEWLTETGVEWFDKEDQAIRAKFVKMNDLETEVTLYHDGRNQVYKPEDLSKDSWKLARQWSKQTNAMNAYLLVIQGGAILAVGILYWPRIFSMTLGILGLDPKGRALVFKLILAFLPAAVLGLLFGKRIKELLFFPLPVAIALMVGAFLMFWSEGIRKKRESIVSSGDGLNLDQMSFRSAFFIGLLQCLAMFPGTSRSMMTIVGGYLVGLRPAKAAEFSFLLGLVTLMAVTCHELVLEGASIANHLDRGPVLVGCLVAGVSAALSVHWLVGYLTRRGLGLFAWYRLALGALVLVWLA